VVNRYQPFWRNLLLACSGQKTDPKDVCGRPLQDVDIYQIAGLYIPEDFVLKINNILLFSSRSL
jgi:hypothetical protein